MFIQFPSLHTIGKSVLVVCIGWHALFIGVAGAGNTLRSAPAKLLLEHGYKNMKWYATLTQQNQQNWGFFSFVPTEIVRISFATWDEEEFAYKEFDEYRLTEPPFVGRHNMFNFVRSITEQDEKYAKIRQRYVQWYCKEHNISDTTVYLRKKYAALPQEELLQYYNWSTFTPEWNYTSAAEVYCPAL